MVEGSSNPFAIVIHELVPLVLGKHEDVVARPDVHLDAGSLEGVGFVGPEHFDLELVAEPTDVGHWHTRVGVQPAILRGEQSGLRMRIATTASVSLSTRMKS
jgi:hypothetical protein